MPARGSDGAFIQLVRLRYLCASLESHRRCVVVESVPCKASQLWPKSGSSDDIALCKQGMRTRRWQTNLVLIIGASLVAVLLPEVALRLAGVSYPNFWQLDSDVGTSSRPGAEGWWKRDGEAHVRISSAGLRDQERSVAKPPHTLRIAVLCDSYAEAVQIPIEDTFWKVLERELRTGPRLADREPEVINCGVSGYGTAQELLMLRHRVWAYDPDVVLLAFVTGNDIRNNSRELEPEKKRPFFLLDDGKLVPDVTFRKSGWFRFKQSAVAKYLYPIWNDSRIFQLAREVQRVLEARSEGIQSSKVVSAHAPPRGDERKATPWDGYAEAGLDAMVYIEPEDRAWREAWEITEDLLILMSDEVKNKGADFIVVTLTSGPQVYPDPAARRALEKRLGAHDLYYPDMRICDLGRRNDFPVFNLAPLFERYADQHQVFLHGFANSTRGTGHWNIEGHHLAGKLIAQNMCANLQR